MEGWLWTNPLGHLWNTGAHNTMTHSCIHGPPSFSLPVSCPQSIKLLKFFLFQINQNILNSLYNGGSKIPDIEKNLSLKALTTWVWETHMNILFNLLGMEKMQWVFLWKKLSARDLQAFHPIHVDRVWCTEGFHLSHMWVHSTKWFKYCYLVTQVLKASLVWLLLDLKLQIS